MGNSCKGVFNGIAKREDKHVNRVCKILLYVMNTSLEHRYAVITKKMNFQT